jgi:hypothetical protein
MSARPQFIDVTSAGMTTRLNGSDGRLAAKGDGALLARVTWVHHHRVGYDDDLNKRRGA